LWNPPVIERLPKGEVGRQEMITLASMAIEHTFIMVKPDGVARGLVGEIISRLEHKGLTLEKIRRLTIDDALARRHYAEHLEKPFFPELLEFITSGPVVAMEWSGESAISVARALMGATDPAQADQGTIRGDFGLLVTQNLVHGSDGPESAARELDIYFAPT
jgi:nucleoside-diphosphate kinase